MRLGRRARILLACLVVLTAAAVLLTHRAQGAPAGTGTPLDAYLDDLKTLRASFLQTLADPHGREIDRATGTLIVSRPGRFSWEIHPQGKSTGAGGAGQLMVCDGTNLWFLDRDLQQVTVKPVDAALSATPVMLLSGSADVRRSFKISPAGQRSGLDWVLVEPAAAEGADFRSALFGFEHGELRRMILEDKLGQTATIIFDKVVRNGPVAPAEVSFTAPAGADVIGTPVK
ncbi:MAG TPA: outer membrane lipoprotein chaperone LolA [Steroidobacteraceae bacterium]|jgi:outer membrane lipoprotein carrier protein|nr:outer membrane lipoprotein chaperone LolA [Steroidobacteraceae bacterium]